MNKQQLQNAIHQAEQELALAQKEINRPHEDVVTLSACQNLRSSMRHLMIQYLLSKGVQSNELMSLEQLMDLCIISNESFSSVPISAIKCKGLHGEQCDGKYCLSVENVGCCIDAATDLKNIVLEELNIGV
jgi:hypothetical protein